MVDSLLILKQGMSLDLHFQHTPSQSRYKKCLYIYRLSDVVTVLSTFNYFSLSQDTTVSISLSTLLVNSCTDLQLSGTC